MVFACCWIMLFQYNRAITWVDELVSKKKVDMSALTCITLLLRPVMSASFCSVWASGLLSWANWACMICVWRENIDTKSNAAEIPWLRRTLHVGFGVDVYLRGLQIHCLASVRQRAACLTCSCSAVNDVRALLDGLGWLSCSVGTAPSNVIPLPEKKNKADKCV